jgi:hypothetical protein
LQGLIEHFLIEMGVVEIKHITIPHDNKSSLHMTQSYVPWQNKTYRSYVPFCERFDIGGDNPIVLCSVCTTSKYTNQPNE